MSGSHVHDDHCNCTWGDILTPEEMADMERIDLHAAECGEDCAHTLSEVLGRPFPEPPEEPAESTVLADLNAAAHQFRHAPREPEPKD